MSRRDLPTGRQTSVRRDGPDRVPDMGDEYTVWVVDAGMVFFGRLVAVRDIAE